VKKFGGAILFLDRDDINTDEIIPAKYLTESSKAALKPHCLEDLKLEGFDPDRDLPGKGVIVSRANFGCGSSREHAPWALEANGINLVIAANFARIFRQNMFNGGMIAARLPASTIDELFRRFRDAPTRVEADVDAAVLTFASEKDSLQVPLTLEAFERELVISGGWVEYANAKY
jgi:3-isopropylmalate/(R)-2-methylmalate dehydratase small subunit